MFISINWLSNKSHKIGTLQKHGGVRKKWGGREENIRYRTPTLTWFWNSVPQKMDFILSHQIPSSSTQIIHSVFLRQSLWKQGSFSSPPRTTPSHLFPVLFTQWVLRGYMSGTKWCSGRPNTGQKTWVCVPLEVFILGKGDIQGWSGMRERLDTY